MVAATILFAASSAASKWLVATYPVGEVLFTRTAVSLITCALFILPRTGLAVFRTRRLRHHVMRAVSQGCSQTFLLIAFSLMPLAGAIAINFSAPLFATLVSALLLKEAVGPARWAALLVGFCGVLIVTNPGADTFQIGALFALANAVLYGTVTAAVRGMTATELAETLTLYQLTLLTALLRAAAAVRMGHARRRSTPPDHVQRRRQRGRPILVDARAASCAGLGGGAVLSISRWSGRAFWASRSGATCRPSGLVIGSAIVVASGLFLLWRESNARQAQAFRRRLSATALRARRIITRSPARRFGR